MKHDDDQRLGRRNYAGYCAASTTKTTWDGKPLPTWEQLTDVIRAQWQAGAERVLRGDDGDEADKINEQPTPRLSPTGEPLPR